VKPVPSAITGVIERFRQCGTPTTGDLEAGSGSGVEIVQFNRKFVQYGVFGEAQPSTSRLVWVEESGDFDCRSVGFIE
jgi:hypothetical protein